MAKYCLKKASKRVGCAKRYKIEKKVREHNRKVKKEAKKNPQQQWKTKNKTVQIPNNCPFKEQLLQQAEAERQRIQDEKNSRIAKNKEIRIAQKRKITTGTLEQLMSKAAKKDKQFEAKQPAEEAEKEIGQDDKSIKVYASEVRKMIETADIVIEVLDARDPLGSRNASVEEQVVRSGKRLVLLMNKIDLVPKENVQQWLKYFRGQMPCIAFKASTQEQNNKIGRFNAGSNLSNSATAKCIGADLVMKLLANYCRNKDIKTSIRVGVVGYPNVGKSSVINSLKRKRACNVGAMPGITKQIQEVELDKHIRLLDSPGVVLATRGKLDAVEVALKNAVRVDQLDDPVAPVLAILRRCSKETLMMHYTIPEFKNVEEFLVFMARKLGRMKKGARPDMNAAARHVLNDWNGGRLRYYTQPPEEQRAPEEIGATTQLVEQFSKEFDIDALLEDQNAVVESVPMEEGSQLIQVQPGIMGDMDDEEEGENMETGEGPRTVITGGGNEKKTGGAADEKEALPQSLEIGGNVQLNRLIKQAVKKGKKAAKKLESRTSKLTDSLDMANLNKQENYDFDSAMQ